MREDTQAIGVCGRSVVHCRYFAERDQQAPRQADFINPLNDLSAERVLPLPGATPEDDKLCTMAGIESMGYSAELD